MPFVLRVTKSGQYWRRKETAIGWDTTDDIDEAYRFRTPPQANRFLQAGFSHIPHEIIKVEK